MIRNKLIAVLMLASCMAEGSAFAQQGEVTTVRSVDLERYVGKWYEVARIPNRFQKECTGNVTAEYKQRLDGMIDVINRCLKTDGSYDEVDGVAKAVEDSGNAKLKVSFAPAWLSWIPFLWGDYWVIGLAPDYSYAVVGEPERNNLWILSRSETLPQSSWREAVEIAASQGFDADKLVKTPQGR